MIIEYSDLRRLALGLAEDGYVPIFGEFNDQLAEIVIECILLIRKKGKGSATLLINSNGGYSDCFSAIKAAMLESGIRFKGIVMGKAISNGFNLLQQCDERLAVRDAYMMFHWGSVRFGNSQLAAIISGESWPMETAKESGLTYATQVSERTGIAMEKLVEFALYERLFTASQALSFNMIDKIIDDLPTRVKTSLEKGKES